MNLNLYCYCFSNVTIEALACFFRVSENAIHKSYTAVTLGESYDLLTEGYTHSLCMYLVCISRLPSTTLLFQTFI